MTKLHHGDALDVLATLPENSIDAIVTDPPYGFAFMGKRWDYDVPSVAIWQECLRVLKPGGHLLAFGGTRTYHRLAIAIEDAGFDIRDMIAWVYGSGFPKSHDISKSIDKAAGAEREVVGKSQWYGRVPNPRKTKDDVRNYGTDKRTDDECNVITAPAPPEAAQWDGWGTALKPAHEPICLARKPLSEGTVANNVLRWGTGGINIDGCRVGTDDKLVRPPIQRSKEDAIFPLGCGKQVEPRGRFPANFIHDGSQEVMALFPVTYPSHSRRQCKEGSGNGIATPFQRGSETSDYNDAGSAARFFYCAKASKRDRDEGCEGRNHHPTVKPTALMRYLVRLVTPPGGVVLDPFMGSGSTGKACVLEGFAFVGIEKEAEYVEIARARIAFSEQENQ